MTHSDYNTLTYIIDKFRTSLSDGQSYVDRLSDIYTTCSADWRDVSSIVDDGDYSILINGTPITSLKKADVPCEYMKFLDSNHISCENQLCSKGFTYGQLSDFMVDNIERALNLGSMCHESKFNYSDRNHRHDGVYSKVDIDVSNDDDLVTKVAEITVTTDRINGTSTSNIYNIRVPVKDYTPPPEPYIGTIRFTMVPNIDTSVLCCDDNGRCNVDIQSDTFDGWVYPNGFVYDISQTDAIQRFDPLKSTGMLVQDDSGYHIDLPCLSNYFRLNPGNGDLLASRKVDFHNAVPSHAHIIKQMDISGRIRPVDGQGLAVSTGGSGSDGTVVHNGGGSFINIAHIPFNISCRDIQFQNLTLQKTSPQLDVESEPTHYMVPVMIYIGGRKKSWYRN